MIVLIIKIVFMKKENNLNKLLSSINLKIKIPEIIINDISLNSKNVKKNGLFIAISGHEDDGRKYILDAISKGASAILTEDNEENITYKYGVPIFHIKDLKKYIPFLGAKFYNFPNRRIKPIGVTGTNGKTSVTCFISQMLEGIGEKSAIMGSLGIGRIGNIKKDENTTTSSVEIQKNFHIFSKENIKFVSMEISSHGLVQNRVSFISFESVIFTNLSHDHFDYHINEKEYIRSKWLLFSKNKSKSQIINIDDNVGYSWIKTLSNPCIVSIEKDIPHSWKEKWMKVKKIKFYYETTNISFNSYWGEGKIVIPLVGKFNVYNVILSMSTLLMMGYDLKKVISSIKSIKRIPGRMEIFKKLGKPKIIVDYAHNPEALKQSLITASFLCKGELWCIFGCGGNRDKKKRKFMGKIAEKYSDKIIITTDNPRNESQKEIEKDILEMCTKKNKIKCISTRIKAIQFAFNKAKKEDVILIAGKGHENYQIIGKKKIYHSDRMISKQLTNTK
ncbi:hypothetical protein AOQ88_01840 [Candidatus Riesia sp. GBBU]|nr:hypothetical protein AOQ88_01840 [Candidatus Riesia sp. GBBU]